MSTFDSVRRGPSGTPTSTDRDALIEQLLLAGLDHYFAARFEQAIHVWTRVFFLDRGHTRARAYIERARSAIAEREREAEARAHLAVEAASDSHTLLKLPVRAIDHPRAWNARTSAEPAVLLEREEPALMPVAAPVALADTIVRRSRPASHAILVVTAAVLLFGAGYVVAARDRIAGWWRSQPHAALPVSAPDEMQASRASERILARARELFAAGQLAEALRMLELIADDKAIRHEADRLLVDVHRALLAAEGAAPATVPGPSDVSSAPAVR